MTVSNPGGGTIPYVTVQDQKPAGTDGGGFTTGAWRTRDLNTLTPPSGNSWISLAANQITLQAGSYRIRAEAPAFAVNVHKTRLRNITDGSTPLVGSNEFSSATAFVGDTSTLEGRVTISGTKVFELQHQGAATQVTNGFGTNANMGEVELYSSVEIWKDS